jgi:type II secretory pathway predicted ATPase ExeA/septal ring-binding cell division protein DamX
MYSAHFGLERMPFRITPDTRLFYTGGRRGDVLEALVYAVTSGEGIVKVVGEVGTGKTMLCRMLEERVPANVRIVYLANPSLTPEDILQAIALELGLEVPPGGSRLQVMHCLHEDLLRRHAANQRVVALVEEAQSMPMDTLEEIRLLSNLETKNEKLLQIVLFGQPELDANLARAAIRQLRDRITHGFRLTPLARGEVRDYLNFRLRASGYRGRDVFTDAAYRLIARASEGLTRRVNVLADKAMLAAFAEGTHEVTGRHVKVAVRDSGLGSEPRRVRGWSPLVEAVCAAALAVLAAVGGWYLGRSAVESVATTPVVAEAAVASPAPGTDAVPATGAEAAIATAPAAANKGARVAAAVTPDADTGPSEPDRSLASVPTGDGRAVPAAPTTADALPAPAAPELQAARERAAASPPARASAAKAPDAFTGEPQPGGSPASTTTATVRAAAPAPVKADATQASVVPALQAAREPAAAPAPGEAAARVPPDAGIEAPGREASTASVPVAAGRTVPPPQVAVDAAPVSAAPGLQAGREPVAAPVPGGAATGVLPGAVARAPQPVGSVASASTAAVKPVSPAPVAADAPSASAGPELQAGPEPAAAPPATEESAAAPPKAGTGASPLAVAAVGTGASRAVDASPAPPAPEPPAATGVKPASAVTGAEVLAHRLAVTRDWLKGVDGSHYSIQLLATEASQRRNLEAFLRDRHRAGEIGEVYVYQTVIQGRPWFGVLYGYFPSLSAARRALRTLSEDLLRYQPFIRNISDVDAVG